MFKIKKLFLLIVCFIFTKLAFAEMSLSGYTEFLQVLQINLLIKVQQTMV